MSHERFIERIEEQRRSRGFMDPEVFGGGFGGSMGGMGFLNDIIKGAARVFGGYPGSGPRARPIMTGGFGGPLEPLPTMGLPGGAREPGERAFGGIGALGEAVANLIILRQTTTAAQRGQTAPFFPRAPFPTGDISPRSSREFDQAFAFMQATGQTPAVSNGQVIPFPGGQPASLPRGTCADVDTWVSLGSPRGFEAKLVGGQFVLCKRGRRKRRMGLTKTQMAQIGWACNLPAACRKEVLHGIIHH